MGNQPATLATQPTTDVLKTYESLINMGFDEAKSMTAATKYPTNMQKAINFILATAQQKAPGDDQKNQVGHKHFINDVNSDNTNDKITISEKSNKIVGNSHHKDTNINDNNCDGGDITKCNSLDRLIEALKYQKINKHNYDNTLSEYFDIHKKYIINDYHHILSKHLNNDNRTKQSINETIELIYNKCIISGNNNNEDHLLCDVSKCIIYKKHHREREKDKNNIELSTRTATDILGTIHCFFIHSVDTGYTITDKLKIHDTINHVDDNTYCDKQLIVLKQYLKSKRNQLSEVRGTNRMKNNKFHTDLNVNNKDEDKKNESQDDDDNEATPHNEYSFGVRFNCWGATEEIHHNYYHKLLPKYSSLKAEILSNAVYHLEGNVFKDAYNKASQLINHSQIIKQIKSHDDKRKCNEKSYGITSGESLKIDNILSIILYTDYDTLQYNFSLIFRDVIKGKGIGNEYYHWIKILTETVNCYGTNMVNTTSNVLYHGVSYLYFNRFIATFNSPTSTTTKLQVATIFAKNDGIILELNTYDRQSVLSYFNCSFMSSFPAEDERLFIQPPGYNRYLKFIGIRNMETNENYTGFINVLTTFQQIISRRKHGLLDSPVSHLVIDEINNLMDISSNCNNKRYPIYINQSFLNWAHKITRIRMDVSNLSTYCVGLRIFNQLGNNIVTFDKINKIFKQIRRIVCYNIGSINSAYLASVLSNLQSVNEIIDSKLNYIRLGNPCIKFSISQFTQYESLFAENNWKIQKGYGLITIERK